MVSADNKWCTIESDPGVFTELINEIGVNGVQMEELMTLEDDELNQHSPIYGLIFLFKWVSETEKRETLTDYDPELFFANQVINNACATQAILSILMNRAEDIDLGDELKNMRSFSTGLPSREKGLTIGNSEKIRVAHNSFTRQEPFIMDEDTKPAGKSDEVYHFISFVPYKNQLYELDGLQAGPISYGECSEDTWLTLAKEQIQARMEKYAGSEIRFNLMAVVGDKIAQYEKEIAKQKALEQWIVKKRSGELAENVAKGEGDLGEYAIAVDEIKNLAALEVDQLSAYEEQVKESQSAIEVKIADEKVRRGKWKAENERRRHNYVPLIFELLKKLAQKNMLSDMYKKANDLKEQKAAEKKNTDVEMKA